MKFVIDTSLFVNPETQKHFGDDLPGAVRGFLKIAREQSLELYMPLSVYSELSHFVDGRVLSPFRRRSCIRGPDLHNLKVPAAIFHAFIAGLRSRIDRGLRVAERAMRRKDPDEQVRWLREHYRAALRTGIVDSVEDLEVVLLAKEIGGAILSADEGIANMAEELGIEVLSAGDFVDRYSGHKD